ncbi:MAG: hypothetical protein MHMPM18_001723 [Marteilia pararefringens]
MPQRSINTNAAHNMDSSKCCRFGYPMPYEATPGHFIKHDYGTESSWKYVPERHNERVVNYNPLILQTWHANLDITPVTSTHVLVEYITRYITKSDQKKLDDVIGAIFGNFGQQLNEDDRAQEGETGESNLNEANSFKIIARIMEKNSCNKLITSQEVFFRLLGIEYFSSSRAFKFVSALTTKISKDGTQSPTDVQLAYSHRLATMENLSLVVFAREYEFIKRVNGGQIHFHYSRREKDAIVSTPLRFIESADQNYATYLREWLLHYQPKPRAPATSTTLSTDDCVNENLYQQILSEKYNDKDPEDEILQVLKSEEDSRPILPLNPNHIISQQSSMSGDTNELRE